MMKWWSRLWFLVVVVTSVSRGRGQHDPQLGNESALAHPDPPTPSPHGAESNATDQTLASTSSQSPTSTDGLSTERGTESSSGTTRDESVRTEASAGTSTGAAGVNTGTDSVTVSTLAPTTSSQPDTKTLSSSAGYVILVLIIVLILVLCIILYCLRRVSRSYSFDLQRQDPITNQLNEATGTFEPVYLDDLDQPSGKDHVISRDLSPAPVSNGTSLQSEEKGSNGEDSTKSGASLDPQEKPDANGLETLPVSNTGHASGSDLADKTSKPPGSVDLLLEPAGRLPENENNNNPSVLSNDPFVEINLEDTAWCDRLLASSGPASSVLPFFPFSFSSSSSSSSS